LLISDHFQIDANLFGKIASFVYGFSDSANVLLGVSKSLLTQRHVPTKSLPDIPRRL
jgi:hypothetical protein